MLYFGSWKANTFYGEKDMIWVLTIQNFTSFTTKCFDWEAYGFDQIRLCIIFISLSSPIDSEKRNPFDIIVCVWSNSILLAWFPFL